MAWRQEKRFFLPSHKTADKIFYAFEIFKKPLSSQRFGSENGAKLEDKIQKFENPIQRFNKEIHETKKKKLHLKNKQA